MATTIPLPKLGNTVESSIIQQWRKKVGDEVQVGDVLCEVETDKAVLEVESPAAGVLLALYAREGEDVPVLAPIALIGAAGEAVEPAPPATEPARAASSAAPAAPVSAPLPPADTSNVQPKVSRVSPRARKLAERKGIAAETLTGNGPGGRVIERDVLAALESAPKLTPLAKAMIAAGAFSAPDGASGRVTSKDLLPQGGTELIAPVAVPASGLEAGTIAPVAAPASETIPLKGARKIIAQRMLESLQTTAQLTMNAFADARALQALRQRFKSSPAALGLQGVTINDLLLYVVARTLPQFPHLNAHFQGETITQYSAVQLGLAVDTPRGLLVPVIREAQALSLKTLSAAAHDLAVACQAGKITPDALNGGTFTVTNLGSFGVETFTPVLNPPQVAILGVGTIHLKPVPAAQGVEFVPHIGLSLTINHQVVDGAPGARFLQALAQNVAQADLLLAV